MNSKPTLGREDLCQLRRRKLRGDRELRDDIARNAAFAMETEDHDCAPDEDPFHRGFRNATVRWRNQ